LCGPQLGRIRAAIVSAYGGSSDALDELNIALTDNFEDRDVYKYVIVNQKFDLQVATLLKAANGQGWLPALLGALQQRSPDAEELQEVIGTALATAPARQVLALAGGGQELPVKVRTELQEILPGGALVDLPTMQRRVRCVCRIDYADYSPPGTGTGFLVGTDLVLTNWHVVKRIEEAPEGGKAAIAKELRFRFDLLDRVDAVEGNGRAIRAKLDDHSPILRSSPAAGMEITAGSGEPGMNALDYALVRLDEPAGNDRVPGGVAGETRGHIQLRVAMPQPVPDSALMVLQHPLRGELQFAIGRLLGPNGTGSRVKHTAATQKGSSGSPVLDAALAPIALHNGTRQGTEQERQPYNTAVPLAHIVHDLRNAGISEMLQE
jgi:hypothetical protein